MVFILATFLPQYPIIIIYAVDKPAITSYIITMPNMTRDNKSKAILVKSSPSVIEKARSAKRRAKNQQKQLDDIQEDVKKILAILSRLDTS